jgi:hypothetical protein
MAAVGCTVKDSHPVAVTPQVVPTELWVAQDGLDSNPGTRAAPLRSLARAAQLVTPGTTVNVLPGTYQGGFRTSINGLANARIVFRSTERWQARLVPPPVSGSRHGLGQPRQLCRHPGLRGRRLAHRAGRRKASPGPPASTAAAPTTASPPTTCTTSPPRCPAPARGGSGIGVDSYYKGMYSEVVGNSVHDIGPPGCRYVQGIYVNTPGTVRNNVVYRVAEAGIHLWHDAHKVIVVNNTITASNTGILVGGGDFYHTKGPNDNTHVFNNIVYDNRYGISEQGATGKHNSYRNNLVFGNREADWRLAEGMRHSGTIAAVPGFLGYSRSGTPGLPPGGGFAGNRQGPREWRRRPRLLRQVTRARQTTPVRHRRLPALITALQDLVHQLRRPAQAHALRRHHERPVDQDRVGDHGVQQGLVADAGRVQPQLAVQRFLAAHRVAHRQAGARDHFPQLLAFGRGGQVVDHLGLMAGVADQAERGARGAAARIVKNLDVHR